MRTTRTSPGSSLLTRSTRTCAPTTRAVNPAVDERKARVVARLLRELLRAESFTDLGSIREALKVRCARLRIGGRGPSNYGDLVDRALVLVGSNVTFPDSGFEIRDSGYDARPKGRHPNAAAAPPLSMADARRVLVNIQARLGAIPIKQLPPTTGLRTGREKGAVDA
jgi:hypothetical protein